MYNTYQFFTGANRETVRLILRPVMRPYHYIPQPTVRDTDPSVRLRFARWVAQMEEENPGWTRTILFSDESNFTQGGTMNRQNYRYWSENNPRWTREVENQRRWTLNVWGGIVGDRLVGPHYFEGPLNGAMYIQFLQNDLPRLLQGNPVPSAQMWFHQDCARPHSSRDVTNYLDAEFPGRGIGNMAPGNRKWPPRSPDMTPLDFYHWGRLKDRCYAEPPTTKEDMRQRIIREWRLITPRELQRVRRQFLKIIHCVIEHEGGHVQPYLN
uniref:Tc1-like transposase DDE domain-containing protein n=1 Tax=Trichogramma kaykai TaxID=54128 RepID=A0ABD2XHU5_9HYME